jgi:hypothetical protein
MWCSQFSQLSQLQKRPWRGTSCTIYVQWVDDSPDRGGRRPCRRHTSLTVSFANCTDLVQQLDHLVSPERWHTVYIRAPDMAPEFPDVELDEHNSTTRSTKILSASAFNGVLSLYVYNQTCTPLYVYNQTCIFTLSGFPEKLDEYCRHCVALKRRLQGI